MKNLISLIFLTFTMFVFAQEAPVANDQSITINEGEHTNGTLSGSDADSDNLSFAVVGTPNRGTVTINSNGSFTYVHSGGEGASDSFTFSITDDSSSQLTSNIATVTITINPVNDAPVIADISKTLDEGASAEISVSGTDAESAILVYEIVSAPSNGTFTLDSSTGLGYYTHNGSETTSDSFVVRAKESTAEVYSANATVTITVNAVNDSPLSPDGTVTLDEGTSSQSVSFGASDAEGSSLTINVSSQGSFGTAVVSGGDFVYTHDGSETTSDTFSYSVSDGTLSSTGMITVTINPTNDAPTGVADTYYVTRNSTTQMAAEIGVLRNDTDSDSDSTLFSVSQGSTSPQYGQLTLNQDGSFSYITDGTNSTFNSDTFSYTVSDGSATSSEVTVTLEVASIIPVPNSYTNAEGATLTVDATNGVVTNDVDPNGLTLSATVVANPTYGTLTLNADGSFTYVHDGTENRKDSFTYNLKNANDDESKSTFVVINNTNVNDAPTSSGTIFTLNEGASNIFTPTYADTDTQLTGIAFAITTDVTNGVLSNNGDGTYTYIHNGGETTSDTFTYSVSDGEFTVENLAGAITVTAVNDIPVATNLSYTLNEAGSIVIDYAGTDAETAANDLDFVKLSDPTNGSITVANGVTTYTHNGSETTSDSFTFAAYDGTVQSAAGTVSITLNPVNSAPIVSAVAFTINEDASTTFNLGASSTEPEGQTMTYTISTPTNGTASVNAGTGEVSYDHDGSETTTDTFTFTATDSEGLASAAGTITVTLNPVNDAPIIADATLNVDQYDELTFSVPGTDAEGSSLTYTIVTNPSQGTLEDNGSGSYTYYNDSTADLTGSSTTDTFVVKANDGTVDSENKTLTFTIAGIDESIPQIILTSNTTSLTETDAGGGTLTVNAILVSNSFYSNRRDMNADPVAVGATNSLGYKYIGEYAGHKYYYKTTSNDWKTNSDAKTMAAAQGGYLWTIESEAEQTAVRNLLDAQSISKNDIWLGLNHDYTDKTWKWINGHSFSGEYVNWNPYDASEDSSGFITKPVVKHNSNGWQNHDVNQGGRILIEFDNNVTASSDITFEVAAAGTATVTDDYILSASTITISSGASSGTLTVTEVADTVDEASESIILEAGNVTAGIARIKRSQNSLTVNLVDNEKTSVAFSTTKTTFAEADGDIVMTATLNNVKPFDTAITLTLGGTATVDEDYSTDDDGYLEGIASGFNSPEGVVQATSGDYYVAEERRVYKVAANGTKTLIAGDGNWGNHSGDAQPISQAKFRNIGKMVVHKASARSASGSADVIYLYDERVIRKIDLGNSLIYYITGSGDWTENFVNGTLAEAKFRSIRDITLSNDGNTLYVIDENAIRAIDMANDAVSTIAGNRDWGYQDGSLSSSRFEGPQGLAMDSSGDLIVRQYGKLRKIDIDGNSVTTLLENDWSSGDLFIDSSDNVYFASEDRHYIYKYSSDGEFTKIISSENDSGTVDGVLKDAKIERPMDIILNSAGDLVFVERNSTGSLRKIDFVNKLRIPAGQQTGTFTLTINDDGSFEDDETISVVVASAENIYFNSDPVLALTIDGIDNTLAGYDSAPEVTLVSAASNIAEEGGSTILTFQLGDASESGARQDMSEGSKGEYAYLGAIGTHKYYMSYNYETWTEARDVATGLGGYLVAVNDQTENDWIRARMKDAGYEWNSVWIGYTDESSEGIFEWANGSDSTYENWQNGEPNNSGGEDYTELMSNGRWNDLPNNNTQLYVIEFSGTVSSLPTVITYTATESETGEFILPTVAPITIAAGSSKATLTVSAKSDTDPEGLDTVTYAITGVTNGTAGSKSSTTVTIDDNDPETATIATISDPTFAEEAGELVITATIPNAKTFASSLGVTINQGGSDTATFGTDFEITELNNVSTLAGSGTSNYSDGTGDSASFSAPGSIVSDSSGNLYVADGDNNVIRKVTTAGVVTTFAGNGNWAHDREEGFRTDVGFARPRTLVFNSAGELFVFEDGRHRISKINTSGNVTRVIGDYNGSGWGDTDGDKTQAQFSNIYGMAFDSSGNLFVTDSRDGGKIKKITFDPGSGDATSTTFAGTGNWGEIDGPGNEAEFRNPGGIVIDANDIIYVADRHNHKIRKITASGVVSTFAGDGYGDQDGSLLNARFQQPFGMSADASGDIYIAESDGNRIRKIDISEGSVSTVAGTGTYGHLDSTLLSSQFKRPEGVLATTSTIYIADTDNHRIRQIELLPTIKIPAGSTSGTLTLKGIDDFKFESDETATVSISSYTNLVNSSIADISTTVTSQDAAPVARISIEDDVLDEQGAGTTTVNVSLSDAYSSSKVDMSPSDKADYYYLGTYNGSKYYSSKNQNHYNYSEAKSLAATLGGQLAIITSPGEQETIVNGIFAEDPDYSPDNNRWLNHWIGYEYDTNWIWSNGVTSNFENWSDSWQKEEHPSREVAWLHQDGLWYSDPQSSHRRFVVEFSSAISDSNTVVDLSFADANSSGTTLEGADGADFSSNLTDGKLTINAGNPSGSLVLTAVDDDVDESIEQFTVSLDGATGATVDTDTSNTSVNVTINDNELTTVTLAVKDGVSTISEVDGQATLEATLTNAKLNPVEVKLAFADSGNLVAIFGQDYDSSDLNAVSTFAGSGNTGYLDGDAEDAEFSNQVRNIISDSSGNIYVADTENRRIRKIDTQGNVTTYNKGADNYDTQLDGPTGMAFDGAGNMYVTEEWNNRVSKVDPSGNVTRFANPSGQGGSDNGDVSSETRFQGTQDVAFDSQGNMFVLEWQRIRKIEFSGSTAVSSDFVGNGSWGNQDGTGSEARFGQVQNIVIDSNDNIFFADESHQIIKKVTPEGVVTTIAGNGNWDYADGFGTNAKFRQPSYLAIDSDDNLYVSDRENNRIRKIESQSDGKYKVSTIAGNGNYGYVDGTADQAEFKQVTSLVEFSGTLYAFDRDENKLRKLLLSPVMSIPAGAKTASFNISGIDDTAFESTEAITVTPTASGANLASSAALTLSITSDELTPKVVIKSKETVLDENAGTLSFEVLLVDAAGAAANWTNTELPTESADSFDFMGEFNGHKYYFSRNRYTWAQAKQNALELGGQMLVIEDAEENDFVGQIMIYDGTWIGHSRPTDDDSWANIYGSDTYTNWAHVNSGGNANDLTGYALTYGNEWYNHSENDSRHYILEYGPVASSELESSVLVEYTGDATIGDGNDYVASSTIATIPAGSQKTTITLTGLDDSIEEPIEQINMNLALRFSETEVDGDGNPISISNVDLGDTTSLNIQVSDDEQPIVTFDTSVQEISENGGSVTITANLSNAKLAASSVALDLQGTSEQLIDYSVSSIFGYSNYAGSVGSFGSNGGDVKDARFEYPSNMTKYINGSFLIYDDGTRVIRKVDSDGTVSDFIGRPYRDDGGTGDATQISVRVSHQMVTDLAFGNVFWGRNNKLYGYNASDGQVSILFSGQSDISGLAIHNGDIYFSQREGSIEKLSWNGSGFDHSVVAGNHGNSDWVNEAEIRNFSQNLPYYPGELMSDEANNKIYVMHEYYNYWDEMRHRLTILDLNSGTYTHYYNLMPRASNYGTFSYDGDNLYIPQDGVLNIISFTDSGYPYLAERINADALNQPKSSTISNGSLYVSNYNSNTIGKISLSASIDIPAGQTTNSVTLSAFKDPWFESDEIIDVNIGSIVNGTSSSNDVSEVTIVESTRLELVADAPFEGVENGKVSWGDYDRDGDMDLALMGSSSGGTITNVYQNNEGTFVNTNQNFTKFIGGDIEFVDVDQDGWLDVAVSGTSPDGRKSELYINQSGQFFELNTNYNIEGLSQTDMEWADLDNDSDPDLIISGIDNENQFRTYYYTNLGDFNFLKEKLFNRPGFISGEIDIVDANNDGDNDLFATGIAGSIGNQYYDRFRVDNTYYWGSQQSDVDTGFAVGNTEYLDIDGDGLMDFLSIGKDDINSSAVRSYSNLMDLNYLPKLNNADFDFADYNNDGLSDVVISGEDPSDGTAVSKLYVTFADYFGSDYQLVETDLVLQGLRESSVDWIDYDKDGDLDLFLTGLDNDGNAKSLLYKATNTNNLNTPPAKVENVVAQGLGGNGLLRVTWDKPFDDYSTSFRYNVRIGTTPGGSDILYANSVTDSESAINGSTLIDVNSLSTRTNRFLTVLPGTYYVAVQAIDGGNRGGQFSDEVSVTVDYAWNLQRLGGIVDRRLRTAESSSIKFLDIDKDGDKDLIGSNIGTNDFGQSALNIFLFQNDIFDPLMSFPGGGVSSFEVADFNKDGNEDVLIAVEQNEGTRIYLALNTYDQDEDRAEVGDLNRQYFEFRNPFVGDNLIQSVYNVKFAIKDLDNDGLVEVIAAGESSKISSEATAQVGISTIQPQNEDGTIGFGDFNLNYPQSIGDDDQLSSLSFISYDFGDVDNDSDYDFLISGYSFDGYKTILYENKRKLDENGAVVQPIEVYFEETANNFTAVKEGTTQFVDFDSDGKLDIIFSGQSAEGDIFRAYKNTGNIDNFAAVDLGLPPVRNGKFKFGDMFGQGRNDVVYSGTVSGQGTFSRIAYYDANAISYVESNYDLFLDDADIGMADFDGDLDTDIVLTGKWNGDPTSYNYHGYVYMNVRGFQGDGGVTNNSDSNVKTSSANGVRAQSSSGSSGSGSSLNTRPDPPTTIDVQRQRLAEDSFEVVLSWNSGTDAETPDEGLTYSLKIGTTEGGEEILASGSNAEGVRNTGSKGNVENNQSWKLVLPTGTYYAAVQSVDASFIGSQFSGTKEFTVASSYKLGDSNGDDTVNILDLTSNVDYILGTTPTVFVTEVADVNGDGEINVADISGIVNIIMTDGQAGVARGADYDPYNWEYFSNKPVGEATLVRRDGRIYLENDKPVTSLQFTIDSTVEYELSEEMDNVTVVNFVEDGKRTFLMYSFNNQPIDELTDVIFDYLDLNDGDEFEIRDMTAGTKGGLMLNLKYSDESFFDGSENIIQIYPNPAVSNVNLLTDITKKVETIEVDVFNVLGVSVYKTKIDAIGRLNDLDVSMLSSGVYTVRVRMITGNNEEIINVHKLIKK